MKTTNHHIIPDAEKYSPIEVVRLLSMTREDFDNHCEYTKAMLYDRARATLSIGVLDGHSRAREEERL